jgi:hypothetical protein
MNAPVSAHATAPPHPETSPHPAPGTSTHPVGPGRRNTSATGWVETARGAVGWLRVVGSWAAASRRFMAQFLGLGAALTASVILLVFPAKAPPSSVPRPAALVWPHAQTGTIAARLTDGTPYRPLMLLDAHTSVGSAPSVDGRFLRLVLRRRDGSIRLLRRLPAEQDPSFGPVTAAGDVLAWAESITATPATTHPRPPSRTATTTGTAGATGSSTVGGARLWTINLGDGRPARLVTAEAGDLLSYDSQDDLTLSGGRLYWADSDPDRVDVVHVRSVSLGGAAERGGPVEDRVENGTWQLSDWPWLVNGAGTPTGTTTLRNLTTHRDLRVAQSGRLATTSCGPTWCQVTRFAADGTSQVDLIHPDGSGRKRVPVRAIEPAITDVAPLNRFAVLSQAGPNTTLTHTGPLLVFEIATSRTAELSLDAATVSYAHGVLWWSNGNQNATLWHSIDLRTI